MTPYYQDDLVTIYHADCREWMPEADIVVTDPPYGAGKAEWDIALPIDALLMAAERSSAMAIQPGIANICRLPPALGPQNYVWTLAAFLSNGMTRSAVGFGNWIPTLLYARPDYSLFRLTGDSRAFVVGVDDKPDHPSPKPLRVVTWLIDRCPPGHVLDPFMGSGTTLVAAKSLRPESHRHRDRGTLLRDRRPPVFSGSPRALGMTHPFQETYREMVG